MRGCRTGEENAAGAAGQRGDPGDGRQSAGSGHRVGVPALLKGRQGSLPVHASPSADGGWPAWRFPGRWGHGSEQTRQTPAFRSRRGTRTAAKDAIRNQGRWSVPAMGSKLKRGGRVGVPEVTAGPRPVRVELCLGRLEAPSCRSPRRRHRTPLLSPLRPASAVPAGADRSPRGCLGLLECMYANLLLQAQLAQRQMAILEHLQASMTHPAPGRASRKSSLPA